MTNLERRLAEALEDALDAAAEEGLQFTEISPQRRALRAFDAQEAGEARCTQHALCGGMECDEPAPLPDATSKALETLREAERYLEMECPETAGVRIDDAIRLLEGGK